MRASWVWFHACVVSASPLPDLQNTHLKASLKPSRFAHTHIAERTTFTENNNNRKELSLGFGQCLLWDRKCRMRGELENVLRTLKETHPHRVAWAHSTPRRTGTVGSGCCLAGSHFHSSQSRRSCSWTARKVGCKPGFHVPGFPVLYMLQLKKNVNWICCVTL